MRVEIELQSARERSLFELKSKMFAQAKTKFNRFELLTWESKPPFLRSLLRSLACFELNLKLYILFEPKVCRLKQKKVASLLLLLRLLVLLLQVEEGDEDE